MPNRQERKHTPTPWEITDDFQIGKIANELSGKSISLIPVTYIETKTKHFRGNAELIVRAVNNHYNLIHTLANALDQLRYLNGNEFVIKQCEQAIQQAEGK